MTIDYTKLAQQAGEFIATAGSKLTEVAVRGVVAEAWGDFIPGAIASFICVRIARNVRYKFKEFDDNNGWCWMYGFAVFGALVAGIIALIQLSNLISTVIAPEWMALKLILSLMKH